MIIIFLLVHFEAAHSIGPIKTAGACGTEPGSQLRAHNSLFFFLLTHLATPYPQSVIALRKRWCERGVITGQVCTTD